MRVEAVITLTGGERTFLRTECEELIRDMLWKQVDPSARRRRPGIPSATQLREYGDEIERRVSQALPQLRSELESHYCRGAVTLHPSGRVEIAWGRPGGGEWTTGWAQQAVAKAVVE